MSIGSESNNSGWGSRRTFLMVLICQTIGLSTSNVLPNIAITHGGTGYLIAYVLAYILVGMPVLFMELHVSQFTGRDCIDMWKIRPCLSHIGYLQIVWQIIIIIINHVMVSFIVHYLLISFENPIPYSICGNWGNKYCNIFMKNYTVNNDCSKELDRPDYCEELFVTFPEFQYWRYNILKVGFKVETYHLSVAWRVLLGSGLACTVVFLSCMKLQRSVKWCVDFLALYPIMSFLLIMMGSMLQKGVVVKFGDVFDTDFTLFAENFRFSQVINNVVYTLSVGTGTVSNLAAVSTFRFPCYSNTVVAMLVVIAFTVITVCTTAMASCPYAYEYGSKSNGIISHKISFPFVKVPRLLSFFNYPTFWLVVVYSTNVVLGLRTTVIMFYNVLQTAVTRNPNLAKYPGLVSFVGSLFLFLFTIPLISNLGVNVFTIVFRRYLNLISSFMVFMEYVVFVIWYGIGRFTADIHFMQGIRPKPWIILVWLMSIIIIAYVFCYEIYKQETQSQTTINIFGWCLLLTTLGVAVFVIVIKLIVAACRNRFNEMVAIDPSWGPKSEVLQRSRGMFTAHAMTKEYLYRQYHLQAGILERQRLSNTRTFSCRL